MRQIFPGFRDFGFRRPANNYVCFSCVVHLGVFILSRWLKHLCYVLSWGTLCDTFKGAVEAQVSPESSSDAGFEETVDLSCGKDTVH